MWLTLLLADKVGMFKYTVVDMFGGAGHNSWEDVNYKNTFFFI